MDSLRETNLCKDVGIGEKLQFEIELEVKSCKQSRKENFFISPLGIEEKTEIELELICDCKCDSKIERTESKFCSFNGKFLCFEFTISCFQSTKMISI